MSGPEVLNKFVGNSEEKVNTLVEHKGYPGCVVLLFADGSTHELLLVDWAGRFARCSQKPRAIGS